MCSHDILLLNSILLPHFLEFLVLKKSPQIQELTVKDSLSCYSRSGSTFLLSLTEFIDSAKKLKRPWNEMPLSHLRKVIPSQNPEVGPASVSNGLCITSNPGADIKLSLLSHFSVIPWEKSSPHFAEQHPFCDFRSIFLSSLLPREDRP